MVISDTFSNLYCTDIITHLCVKGTEESMAREVAEIAADCYSDEDYLLPSEYGNKDVLGIALRRLGECTLYRLCQFLPSFLFPVSLFMYKIGIYLNLDRTCAIKMQYFEICSEI